ncbi:TPA: hypothetical protein NPP59_001396 [Klebsiella pneumoniae]|nr:hypothetical protein [Klebsiella pneumoniae]HCI6725268.1 hypothetical protein [Klebsiella pneumoniae]
MLANEINTFKNTLQAKLYVASFIHRQQTHCCQVVNVPLAGDKAEVEMSKQGIRALIISAVIGLFIWIALFSALGGLFL